MQYKSPIKALTPFLQKNEKLGEIDLNVLKKRILAEFELSGKVILKTEAGKFNKSDFIDIMDELRNDKNTKHHICIANNPMLLNLLENKRLKKGVFFSSECYSKKEFINFVSPYLASSLGECFVKNIKNTHCKIVFDADIELPILDKHMHLLVEPVYKEIYDIAVSVESIKLYSSDKVKSVVKKYFSNEMIATVNYLPKKYFELSRELYISACINFIREHWVLMHNTRKSYSLYKFLAKQLQKLEVSGSLESSITSINHYIQQSENYKSYSKVDVWIKNGIMLIAAIIIILMLLLQIREKTPKIEEPENFERTIAD